MTDNAANENITATYYVVGELKDKSAENSDGIQRKKCVVCHECDLENTKAQLSTINVCTIYSVQQHGSCVNFALV